MRSRSLLWSFNYAIEGILYALRTQRNMRIHAFTAAMVLAGAVFFRITGLELIALLFALGIVLVTELANTALEATVDLATDAFDPIAKTAKDVAAGAVLVASLVSLAVGYVIFLPKVTGFLESGMQAVRRSPPTLTVGAVGLTALLVLGIKAMHREEGTFLRGGWPSGHTAIATAIATAIGWSSGSVSVWLAAMMIAALVAQSRLDAGVHTVPQVVLGGILGFLLTTAVFQLLLM